MGLRKNRRFFTADLHFGHKHILEYCPRPWANLEDMREGLIANWNKAVREEDEVFVVGDFTFATPRATTEILGRLNGSKYLITGNHDWKIKPGKWARMGFDWVVRGNIPLRLRDGTVVLLCHFPYWGDHTGEERFRTQRPTYNPSLKTWVLHGHVHKQWQVNGPQINVGVDVWSQRPVSEEEIILLMDENKV